jgi:membrane protein involved in colicin uptake
MSVVSKILIYRAQAAIPRTIAERPLSSAVLPTAALRVAVAEAEADALDALALALALREAEAEAEAEAEDAEREADAEADDATDDAEERREERADETALFDCQTGALNDDTMEDLRALSGGGGGEDGKSDDGETHFDNCLVDC